METGKVPLTPSVYSPSRFYDDLLKINEKLPYGFSMPFELKLQNIMKYYAISEVTSVLHDCKIYVNIQFSISNHVLYEAYKGTSVPIMKNGKMFITTFEKEVILKSPNSKIGMLATYAEYKTCKIVQNLRICPSFHILEDLSKLTDCNVQAFFNTSSNSCFSQPINLKHQIWVQMVDENSWVFAVPNITQLDVLFNNKHMSYEISGIGKLKILQPALIKSQEVLLHYYPKDFTKIQYNNFKMSFSHTPLEVKLIDKKVPDTLETKIITNANSKQLFHEIVNLKNMNQDKMQLLDVELERHTFSFWTFFMYVILAVLFLFTLFRIYTYCKSKFSRGRGSRCRTQEEEINSQEIQELNPRINTNMLLPSSAYIVELDNNKMNSKKNVRKKPVYMNINV
ncbi:uncharacterized protein LOC128093787 [Culex pipiens pallens]|uniref:uncharacterized protein LOC128093787 n=1 Tax=Culex pipiens pallens TaxID=42434 RepID=UPI0022AB2B2F|nr:uncharacterized protein LOC128093787 [Culex pipiens pallens]